MKSEREAPIEWEQEVPPSSLEVLGTPIEPLPLLYSRSTLNKQHPTTHLTYQPHCHRMKSAWPYTRWDSFLYDRLPVMNITFWFKAYSIFEVISFSLASVEKILVWKKILFLGTFPQHLIFPYPESLAHNFFTYRRFFDDFNHFFSHFYTSETKSIFSSWWEKE